MTRGEREALLTRDDDDPERAIARDAFARDSTERGDEGAVREMCEAGESSWRSVLSRGTRVATVVALAMGACACAAATVSGRVDGAGTTNASGVASPASRRWVVAHSSKSRAEGLAKLGGRLKFCSKRRAGFASPWPGRYVDIGEWPDSYLVRNAACGPAEARDVDAAKLGRGQYVRPNQKSINDFILDWSFRIGAGKTYAVPPAGKAKHIAMKNSSALFYNFVHVPKAGGTFFAQMMTDAMEKNGQHFGYAYPLHKPPMGSWITLPLVDLTQTNVYSTAEHFRTHQPEHWFGQDSLVSQYNKGTRFFGKGQYGMGFCDAVDGPCVYLTVLRDPVQRYLSHYKYSCLKGSEGKAQWEEEWKAVGHCPLDPIEFMDHLGPNLDWTYQLAPGAKDVAARAAQSMTNLDSNCFRYLILEKYHDGIGKLRSTFPEFSHVGLNWGARNAQPQLAASELARLRRYMSNATIMETIKRRHAKMQEVYDHAVANYDKNWARAPASC